MSSHVHHGVKMWPQKKLILLFTITVVFVGNLNSIVDSFLHPSIPYFDKEHLVVGGITSVTTAILFGMLFIYTRNLRKSLESQQRLKALLTENRHRKALEYAGTIAATGKLSSTIVHEMRNPLSSIKMNLQALSRKVQDDPAFSEMALIASQQSERLEEMLAELLHFSKPLTLFLEEIKFRTLADKVVEKFEPTACDKGLSLQVKDHLGEERLTVDIEHIERALTNLVTNAIQWAPAESIVSIIGRRDQNNEQFLTISVTDRGPGIPKGHLHKLCTPFFTTLPEGAGFGLASAQKIVAYHGGTITAENKHEEGVTMFTMNLPFKGISN
jgi:signal transduction histidine kinase